MEDTLNPRHVKFVDIGAHSAKLFGHPNETRTLMGLLNDPPLANHLDAKQLLAVLVYQQSALISNQSLMIEWIAKSAGEIAGLRKDLKSEKTKVEAARERAAKAEEKAALAKESAALAIKEAALAEANLPPIKIIQVGSRLRSMEKRIKRKF